LLFWTVGDYIIAYHAEAEPVFVLAILHGARDIPSILQERFSTE
jgi:plasmid stabilization system protein ParE